MARRKKRKKKEVKRERDREKRRRLGSATVCAAVRRGSGVEIVAGHYFPLGVRKNDRYAVVIVVVGKADYPNIPLLERERVVLLARKKPAGSRRATR